MLIILYRSIILLNKKLIAAAIISISASLGGGYYAFKDWVFLSPADQLEVAQFINQAQIQAYQVGKQVCKNTI